MTLLDLSLPAVCAHELADEAPGLRLETLPAVHRRALPDLTPATRFALLELAELAAATTAAVAHRTNVPEPVARGRLSLLAGYGLVAGDDERGWRITRLGREALR